MRAMISTSQLGAKSFHHSGSRQVRFCEVLPGWLVGDASSSRDGWRDGTTRDSVAPIWAGVRRVFQLQAGLGETGRADL